MLRCRPKCLAVLASRNLKKGYQPEFIDVDVLGNPQGNFKRALERGDWDWDKMERKSKSSDPDIYNKSKYAKGYVPEFWDLDVLGNPVGSFKRQLESGEYQRRMEWDLYTSRSRVPDQPDIEISRYDRVGRNWIELRPTQIETDRAYFVTLKFRSLRKEQFELHRTRYHDGQIRIVASPVQPGEIVTEHEMNWPGRDPDKRYRINFINSRGFDYDPVS